MMSCAKGLPLTRAALKESQLRWAANGLPSYRLELEVAGDKIETGAFVIEVRNNRIDFATRNDQELQEPDHFYTVDGLFKFLSNELELGQEPGRYFGASPNSRIYMNVHFHKTLGYPIRYLRAVTETKQNITVTVTKLTKL